MTYAIKANEVEEVKGEDGNLFIGWEFQADECSSPEELVETVKKNLKAVGVEFKQKFPKGFTVYKAVSVVEEEEIPLKVTEVE